MDMYGQLKKKNQYVMTFLLKKQNKHEYLSSLSA